MSSKSPPLPNRTNIGVRELKNPLTRIVNRVREEQREYIVTVRGQPIAILRPYTEVDAADVQDKAIEQELNEI